MDQGFHPDGGSPDTDPGEQLNVEGNMLGNWSFALRWDDPSGWMVRAYWQHVFEDHSMLFFDYPWKDGLYGVEARFPKTASCRKSWQNCSIQRIRPARSIGTMCLSRCADFLTRQLFQPLYLQRLGELGNGHRKSVLYLSYI